MILSRFLCSSVSSRIGRLPTSLQLIPLHHETNCVSRVDCKRKLYTNNSFHQSSQTHMKDQFAVSKPRLHKRLQADRAQDNMSEDWVLIFTLNIHTRKLAIIHWVSFVSLCAIPFFGPYLIWESLDEADVILAGQVISKTTEASLFALINLIVFSFVLKYVRNVPHRIYINEKTGKYLAFSPSAVPWKKCVQTEFKSTDINTMPNRIFSLKTFIWGNSDFRILNRNFFLPHMGFRNGHDRYWMLRHADWQQNSKM